MYFLANYLKVRHALEDIKKNINKKSNYRILDIGGGGGASLLAIYNFINKNKISCKEIHIIDISSTQINISKHISRHISSIPIVFYNDDIYQRVDDLRQYDLIIGSNIFCELSNEKIIRIASKLQKRLTKSGLFLVIEQVESGVSETLLEETSLIQKRYKYQNERYKMSNKQIDILEDILHEKNMYCYKDYVKTGYTLRYALYE
jgi:ribosomal protein RSM22 (predicted rRNA methylase)